MEEFGVSKRKICVVITTRGNYAKMISVITKIQAAPDLELQLILGGMVVLEKYGRILHALEGTKLPVTRTINFVVEGESLQTMAKSSGLAVTEFATARGSETRCCNGIADRFECLPIAMAAAY